jgi:3-phosphoshikimate 1-carboxyvinyltransferase
MEASSKRPERLQKVISRAGYASRRVAEDLIAAGRVSVDGAIATIGQRVDAEHADVRIDGTRLPVRPGLVYYLLNKPIGVVTTTTDTHGRPTVTDLVPAEIRVVPVGRLDMDSTGLLILTNDGDLVHHVTHPSGSVTKTYVALVEGSVGDRQMAALREGVDLEDGPAAALAARVLHQAKAQTQVEVVMGEGRNREVRRMFDAIGHPVVALHRMAIGPVRAPELKPGEWRSLTLDEVRELWSSADDENEPAARIPRMTDSFPARLEVRPIPRATGTVRPPGSKSLTNRALVVAAMAEGTSTILHPLESDDTEAMRSTLSELGVSIESQPGRFVVHGSNRLSASGADLDARASGTTARFVLAAATTADGTSRLDGTERMRQRPIGPLVDALRQMGADLTYEAAEGFPPVRIAGGGLRGGTVRIDASASSQYVSAVLMAAGRAGAATDVHLVPPVVSRPYIDNTLDVMRAFGGSVAWVGPESLRVDPVGYRATTYAVEPDASAAVYPWAAAAITGGRMVVDGLAGTSSQPDVAALDVLANMGCAVERGEDHVAVTGPSRLVGVDVDMNHCPDAVLGLAAVAAFADGPSRFSNIANLRIKETDRLAALEAELRRLGAGATAGPDWLEVVPGELHGAVIETYDDHRMAMSFAVAGLRVPGVVIDNPACVAKTWPGFFEWLETL